MKTNPKTILFAALSWLCVAAALLICFLGPTARPLMLTSDADPTDRVAEFLAFLSEGDYAAASALCREALPAETGDGSEDTAALYALLKESWQGEIIGEPLREGDRAAVPVRLCALVPTRLLYGLHDDVSALLARYMDEAHLASDVLNDEGAYREDVVFRAWEEAIHARMAHPEDYMQTYELTLHLRYTRQSWLIVPDEALLNALSGKEVTA